MWYVFACVSLLLIRSSEPTVRYCIALRRLMQLVLVPRLSPPTHLLYFFLQTVRRAVGVLLHRLQVVLVDALKKTIKFEERQNKALNPKKTGAAGAKGAKEDPEDKDAEADAPAASAEPEPAAMDTPAVEEEISEAERIKRKYNKLLKRGVDGADAKAEAEADRLARERELALQVPRTGDPLGSVGSVC
jgi:hypothetical protein